MKLATIRTATGGRPGVFVGYQVLDLVLAAEAIPAARLLPSTWAGILAAEDEGTDLVRRIVDRVPGHLAQLVDNGALVAAEEVKLMAPIPRPGLILSCGTNYRAHLEEFGSPLPKRPGVFIKYSGSVIGPGDAIVLPRAYPDLVDYEAEFCFVFGRACHQVSEATALDYVLGYTLTNDVSARNWAMDVGKAQNATEANQAVMSNTLGKSFPTFAPLGPTIVTKDEMPDPHAVKFQSVLNGEVMQNGDTSNFIFSIPWLIAEFSKHFQFQPGDVVTTGSPPGVGLARKPPVLLRDGGVIEIRNDQIGSLSNPVVAG
jgi:acylpyruvate hydrolase